MTEDTLLPFDLPAVQRKKVTADFAGGSISSDGGLVLLRGAERHPGALRRSRWRQGPRLRRVRLRRRLVEPRAPGGRPAGGDDPRLRRALHRHLAQRRSGSTPSLLHVMRSELSALRRGYRQSHSRRLSSFPHPSAPEAPSLRRHYPASGHAYPLGRASGVRTGRRRSPARRARSPRSIRSVRASTSSDPEAIAANVSSPSSRSPRRQFHGSTNSPRWMPRPFDRARSSSLA